MHYVHVGIVGGQKRVLDVLDLEWQAVVSCPVRVFGTGSSEIAVSALNYWVISPVPLCSFTASAYWGSAN